MSKFKMFFDKVNDDDMAKKEFVAILGDKTLSEATDEQLSMMSEFARRLGVDITDEEMKTFSGGGEELDDEDLANVSGGFILRHRGCDGHEYYFLVDDKTGHRIAMYNNYEEAASYAKKWGLSTVLK